MKLVSAGYKVNGKLAYVTEDGTVLVTYDQYRRAAPGGGNRITVGEWTATHRTERDTKQPKYSFRNEPAQHPLLTLATASTLDALKSKLDKLAKQGGDVKLAGHARGRKSPAVTPVSMAEALRKEGFHSATATGGLTETILRDTRRAVGEWGMTERAALDDALRRSDMTFESRERIVARFYGRSDGGGNGRAQGSVLQDLERLRMSRAVEYVLDQVVDEGEDFEAALKKAARLYELDAQERAQVVRALESVGTARGRLKRA